MTHTSDARGSLLGSAPPLASGDAESGGGTGETPCRPAPQFLRRRVGVVKPPRARGGCLGVIRIPGVEGSEKRGGAAKRASSPRYPERPGELKHLSTRRNRKQPRLPQ